jgi:GNAT superfamily N-acetyltransferase
MSKSRYNIREATLDDIPVLYSIGKDFCTDRFELDSNEFYFIATFLVTGGGVIFVAEQDDEIVGIMACCIQPRQLLYKDKIIAMEPFWYVAPDHRKTGLGVLMLKKYEDWARDLGCDGIQCGSLDEDTNKLLEALNYNKQITTYIKWTQ